MASDLKDLELSESERNRKRYFEGSVASANQGQICYIVNEE